MSTRCHILFTDGDTQLLTYKHCDGYPEHVIPLLRTYWKWYPRTEKLEYLTATWFYYCKRQSETHSVRSDLYDAPMATDKLGNNNPVALSYGICVDNKIHGDTEHFYEVDIEQATVAHYTPEGMWFDGLDSPADIINKKPEETYALSSASGTHSSNPVSCQATGIADGGQVKNDDLDDRCANCGSAEGTNWFVQAGTPAGKSLGLSDGETTELCDECIRKVSDSIGGDDESTHDESTEGDENE